MHYFAANSLKRFDVVLKHMDNKLLVPCRLPKAKPPSVHVEGTKGWYCVVFSDSNLCVPFFFLIMYFSYRTNMPTVLVSLHTPWLLPKADCSDHCFSAFLPELQLRGQGENKWQTLYCFYY